MPIPTHLNEGDYAKAFPPALDEFPTLVNEEHYIDAWHLNTIFNSLLATEQYLITYQGNIEAPIGDDILGIEGELEIAIPPALYPAYKFAMAWDSNLLAENIKLGETIFGVEGTMISGDFSFWGIKHLRLIVAKSGDHSRVIVNPDDIDIPILIGDKWFIMPPAVEVDAVDDIDTGAQAAGTDYYVYACTDGTTLSFKVSANSTVPTGFDAAHSRKIGGFHTLCVAVGAIGGHTLTNYAVKDILPASIWDLKHRAKSLVNVGLVYSSGIQKWVDIYLQSGTGTGTTSVNGGTITNTRTWMDHVDDGNAVGKRLLRDGEFQSIAAGSNEETNIAGSTDPGTTGGYFDTAGRRMISNIGCEDCCGTMQQWLADEAYIYSGTTAYWGNLPGGKGSIHTNFSADPGAPEVDNTKAGSSTKLLAGGDWNYAAYCGSRFRNANNSRWKASTTIGARFVSEPL